MRTRAYRRTLWTDDELTQLRVLYPHHPSWAVAEVMGRSYYSVIGAAYKLGLHKTTKYMASPEACPMKRAIGTIMTDSEGYRRIKVREHRKGDRCGWDRNVWPQLHWHVWRKHHGHRVPKGHALVFRDGDRANCAIENLELISRAELMARNTIHNLPPELQQVIQLNGAVKRRIRRLLNAEKHNDRPA